MKNVILSLFVVFLFSACSNNSDDTPIAPPQNSIKKFTEKSYYNGTVNSDRVYLHNYENSVLKYITDGNNKVEIVYEGAKVSKIMYYTNDVLTHENFFLYEGNLLKTVISDDNEDKTEYTYSNGKLSETASYTNNGTSWFPIVAKTFAYDTTNNIVTVITTNSYNGTTNSSKNTYLFDTKNNPFKSMNPYLRQFVGSAGLDVVSINNRLTSSRYSSLSSTTPIPNSNYQVIYNSNDYPLDIKQYSGTATTVLMTENTFEYN